MEIISLSTFCIPKVQNIIFIKIDLQHLNEVDVNTHFCRINLK